MLRTIDLDEAEVVSRFVKLEPRPYQVKCISELLAGLRKNNDTVLVLPTGMGKSAIYLPISMVAADEGLRACILCATNLLLDQVKQGQAPKFAHQTPLHDIKGLEHYQCQKTHQKADYLFCMSNSERDLCTCGINQASFEKERFVITNFAKFLSTPFKNKFDLIVIDDSHGFENAVEDQFQHQVAYDRVDDLFKRHDVAGDIVGEVTGNLMDIFDDIIAAVPPSELTRRVPDDDIKKIGEIKGSEELPSTLRNLEEIDRDIYLDLFYFIKKCRDLTQNTFYVQKDFYNPLSLRDADLLSRKSDRYIDNVMRMIFGEARVLLVSAYPGKIEEHATYSTRRKHPADRIQVVPKDKPEEVKRWFRNLSLFEVTDVNDPIESGFENCVNLTSEILQKSKVKSLLLFKNYRDQRRAEISLKQKVKGRKITFIDDTFETEKVQSLVEEADVIMVSASSRLWEGINISGLKLEIIFSLPFIRPPVYLDRTRSFPYVRRKMLVRLQQGIGRLIRDPDDRGVCVVLDYANRPTNQTTLSNHVNSRDFSPRIARQDIASEQRPRFRESVRKPDQRIAPSMNTTTTDIDSPRQVLRATYNVNLFELKQYKPLSVSRFHVTVSPRAERPGHFYQVLGRFARKLTKELSTAVISEGGEILVLESPNADPRLSDEIAIEDVGTFRVQLTDANTSLVNFADSPLEYERLVSRIIDIALVQFAPDYYKYHDLSPHIIERGQGFFPQSLREKIGVEDGRQFYRGLRVVDGLPHVLVNRAIQLRSWKHLLNELKVLANWFAESRGIEVDFYNPPDAFVKFANWSFRNRTANNRMYSARSIVIREIVWDKRADDIIPELKESIVDYQKGAHGVVLEDSRQPLIKYRFLGKDGSIQDQFQAPELLVVGHDFMDLSRRVPPGQISQVFDIIHPHCGDQQRRIFDFVVKVDRILRAELSAVYPSRLEISTTPKDVTANIVGPLSTEFRVEGSTMKVQPPYGVNFYRRYSPGTKFVKPISRQIECLALCQEGEYSEFLEEFSKDFARRNGSPFHVSYGPPELNNQDLKKRDLVLTFLDEGEDDRMKQFKAEVVNNLGIAHQNITPADAKSKSVPQLTMQVTLKLGGYPRFLIDAPDLTVLSIYSYRNPLDNDRFYIYNIMSSEGEVFFQSKPFPLDRSQKLLDEIKSRVSQVSRLLVLLSYDDQTLVDNLKSELAALQQVMIVTVFQGEDLRIFSTYHPIVTGAVRRRRSTTASYPIEAYEYVPQGVFLRTASRDYHIVPTSSTKLATYYRGCPTTVRLRVQENTGSVNEQEAVSYVMRLCTVAGTSGHATRLPAPLYYLKLLASYIKKYGLPTNEEVWGTLFYV